jgi:acetyl esterase/lipase
LARCLRIYLHLHDGARLSGGADMQDWLLKGLSDRCNALAASVECRLAPEHPHPAAPDDAEAAALWFAQHATRRSFEQQVAFLSKPS